MEQLFRDYKDIADFRLVYIREAHAADSNRPVGYAEELGINNHTSYEERCSTADQLLNDKSLTIPCVIDDMKDAVNGAYHAWPDRVFLVRTDGRLAVAADRGPWGFKPALDQVAEWLSAFRKLGSDPNLPDDAADAGKDVTLEQDADDKADSESDDDGDESDDDGEGDR